MINRLYSLGIKESLTTYELCKLQIVNRLVVLSVFLDVGLIVMNTIIGNYQGIIIDLGVLILILLPVLFLNHNERYDLAVYLFLFGYHLGVVIGAIHAISQGRANEIENFLIPGSVAIIILLNGIGLNISFVLNFFTLAFLNYLRINSGIEVELDDYYKLIAILVIMYFGIFYFIIHFKTQLMNALENSELLNKQLKEKEYALTESNKSKARMFSIVAHDLRSPITLVSSLLDPDIMKSFDKETYFEYIKTIRTRISVVQETMNNLLGWAQSQLGKTSINKEKVSVDREIDQIMILFQDLIHSKEVEVIHISEKELKAYVDKNHFIIIIRNVLHNAIKFTPKGGQIELNVASNSSSVKVSVKDTGSGIDEDKVVSILDRKLMESSAGTEGEKGSGVGLSFCQELIHKNIGTLNIRNSKEGGAVFEVIFPKA
ncbi:sensor histidine kinase [Reichenbachiella versicolor]|uniref:sensor histidine kinase n=1 Tax=Reichenbachiella versicolor TaxID=1821036 RepID=UPI0013A56109|nr:HAMP domain-containing sensor histidine kinase [Reichenbachiella versicolor]